MPNISKGLLRKSFGGEEVRKVLGDYFLRL
jgi:hypothetical protein